MKLSTRPLALTAWLALALALPTVARAETPSHHPLSCAEILAAPPASHGGAPGEKPIVSDVIFHHVADSTVLEYDLPHVSIDFKRILCQTTGWNGIVTVPGTHFDLDLTPTKHLVFMWVSALLLILVFILGAPKPGTMVPRGLSAALEMLVVFVRDELARKNIPGEENADRYTPYLLTCFFFILFMGLVGLVPYGATSTSNIAVTMGLAILTFVVTQAASIRAAGIGGYLKHLTGGVHWALWPIMIPVEFLGLFTKPFALTIRLFANMVAGHVVIYFLLGLIFIISVWVAPVSVLFAFAIYLLELFVAFVQAYVFTILSALFIGMGVAMGDHGHSHTEDTHHPPGHA